jgi:hypothetical protein
MLALRLLTAAAAGAGLMFLLDPDRGRRRRALLRDQLVSAAHRTSDAMDTTSRDVTNRARGVVAELRGWMTHHEVDDATLRERVRSRIGAVVGHPSAIDVTVDEGRVTLRGPVLSEEVDRLLRRARGVPGVKDVVCSLDVYEEPGTIPALQGRPRPARRGEVLQLLRRDWTPTTRLGAGLAGALLILWGLRRFDAAGLSAAAAGAGLLARGLSNEPLAGLGEIASGGR